ncbi:MAG: hypothetical protein ACJ745_10475 [Actinomycetes bacterium]
MNKRTAIVVAVVAVLLVVPLAGSASAHEEHKVDRYTVEVGFGTPGDYRAFFIPTAQGAYTLKVTGTLGGKQVDQSYTSGKDGLDEVTDPSEVQYPVRQPSGSQLTNRLDRETTRLNTALAAQREAVDEQVAGARRLATLGLVVGPLGLLAAVGVGALALRRRS